MRLVAKVMLAFLSFPLALTAETRFVRGGSDGVSTYAIISRNGVEYRTDELGQRFNQQLWAELGSGDRKALLKAYGWQIGRRIDDFGVNTSAEMAAWIDQELGWTAAAEALKTRHANKQFPNLTPVFGPGATLEIPDYSCVNPEVIKSADYKEALRLDKEIRADWAVGKQVYDMLAGAQWEQVSVAVKAISEPLIKVMVDTFITGFVTNGASKVSELAAQAYSFANDLRDFVNDRMSPGAKPPTAPELIARLETYIEQMETTAESAVTLVQQKKARLQSLATSLKALDAQRTQEKTDAATAVRTALQARTSSVPGAATPPVIEPPDVGAKAFAWLQTNVYTPMNDLTATKTAAVASVRGTYAGLVGNGLWITYPAGPYLPDATDGFVRPYFEVTDRLADMDGWIATLPARRTELQAAATRLLNASPDVTAVLDAELPQINTLDARNRGMDAYAAELGFTPSVRTSFAALRDYSSLIEMAATPGLTAEALSAGYTDHDGLAGTLQDNLPTGVNKRRDWMAAEAVKYENLRFNWENSVSYVIATLRQIDRLHAGPYFVRNEYPWTCYGSTCLYRYSADIAGIRATIAAKATPEARERARMDAVKELVRLRNEESALLQKLEVAQNSHWNDHIALDTFFDALASRFAAGIDPLAEFSSEGHPLRSESDLYNALVPNITYYMLGDNNWIRNRSLLATNVREAIERVSGKILEYYELLNLYQSMDVEKSRYLAMTMPEFDAFMTATTIKLGYGGTYQTAFELAEVWGTEWPAWQLMMKTQRRQEELNAEKRGYPPLTPVAWDIEGTVVTGGGPAARAPGGVIAVDALSGIGVPDIDVLLSSYWASTKTDSAGRFKFTWIGSGGFDVIASSASYRFDQASNFVTVTASNVATSFTATETTQSGYFVLGRVTGATGAGVGEVTVLLTSGSGEEVQVTSADGRFNFTEVPAGDIQVRPVSDTLTFTPPSRTATLAASVNGMDFQAAVGNAAEPGLSIALAGTGSGTVTSAPAGISCPPDCWASYARGTVVRLGAAPRAGSAFIGWYGRCSGTGACTVTMDDVRSVSARFDSTAPADTAPPSITAFSMPATSSLLTVPLTFTATDNVAVTGFLATTDTAQPLPGDSRWTAAPPASYTFSRSGLNTLYGWARDAAGNLTASNPAVVRMTDFSGASPSGVVATATSPTSVTISWIGVGGATAYTIERRAPGGTYQIIASVGSSSHSDTQASPGTAYQYRVTASGAGQVSPPSAPDLATTVMFDDSPLAAGTRIRALHLSQLRTAVAAVRLLANLGPFSFTDTATAGVRIRAVHLTELRTALDQARAVFALSTGSHTDPSLSGVAIKAVHFQELRDRLR